MAEICHVAPSADPGRGRLSSLLPVGLLSQLLVAISFQGLFTQVPPW